MKHFAAALLLMIVVGYVAADPWPCYLEGAPQECIDAQAADDYTVLCKPVCTDYFQSRISECPYNPDEDAEFRRRCQEL